MSPFKSKAQRKFMHANHPEIAERWEKEAKKKGTKPVQPSKKAPRAPQKKGKR